MWSIPYLVPYGFVQGRTQTHVTDTLTPSTVVSVPQRRVRRCARPGLASFTYHRPGRTFLPAARTNARNGGEGASGRLRYSGWPWLGLGLGLALLTLTLTPNPNPNLEAEVERVVEALRVELDDLGTEAALVPAGEGEG